MEVMRLSGAIGERIVGGEDAAEVSSDKDVQENRLVCMVSSRSSLEGGTIYEIVGICIRNLLPITCKCLSSKKSFSVQYLRDCLLYFWKTHSALPALSLRGLSLNSQGE